MPRQQREISHVGPDVEDDRARAEMVEEITCVSLVVEMISMERERDLVGIDHAHPFAPEGAGCGTNRSLEPPRERVQCGGVEVPEGETQEFPGRARVCKVQAPFQLLCGVSVHQVVW